MRSPDNRWPSSVERKAPENDQTKEEFFKILPPTIFFFVALHLVMFIRVLMLKGTAISASSSNQSRRQLGVRWAFLGASSRGERKLISQRSDEAG